MSKEGSIMTDESMCLDVPNYQDENEASARFLACNQMDRQFWRHENNKLVHIATGKCLTYLPQGSSDQLVIRQCGGQEGQNFQLVAEDWKK